MSESLHIVCPRCAAVNRIPASRLGEEPRCGKCHEALFGDQPPELNGATFTTHLQRNDIPMLVDFWAPWCGPCKKMAPAFQQAAAELEPAIRLAKVNTEEQQQIGAQYNIRSIPSLLLFKGGREVARQAGAMSAADIVRWARAAVA